jgi:hypothetical protein
MQCTDHATGRCGSPHIHVNGTQLALGSFDTKEEAAAAFDGAARRHFKEEAKCNFDMKLEDAVSADELSPSTAVYIPIDAFCTYVSTS